MAANNSFNVASPSTKITNTKYLWLKRKAFKNLTDKLDARVEDFNQHPLPPEFKSSIKGPTIIWKVFKRQQEAVDYSKPYKKDVSIFSFEDRVPDSNGRRLYLVTHPLHMWLNHKFRNPADRCTYEVIQPDSPCKLYFDLEFDRLKNPVHCGDTAVHTLLKIVNQELKNHFNVVCDNSNVIWLDSSNEKKYSAHLIYQTAVFLNVNEVGKFVHHIYDLICTFDSTEESQVNSKCNLELPKQDLKLLFVKTKDDKTTLFVDKGVYTKYRNFRLYLSSKHGKNTPLLVSKTNLYKPTVDRNEEEAFFLDSLVSYARQDWPKLLLQFSYGSEEIPSRKGFNQFDFIPQNSTDDMSQGYQQSYYPEIDLFIQNMITRSSTNPGVIRRWTYFEKAELLVYDIGVYRFCENIGRHHRSNNIMMIADIKNGSYYQKCLDPDCRAINFKSNVYQLPPEVLPSFFMKDSMDFESDEDNVSPEEEKEILEIVLQMEKQLEQTTTNNNN